MSDFQNAIKVRVTEDFLTDNPGLSSTLLVGQSILVNTIIVIEAEHGTATTNADGPGPHPTKPPTE